METIEQLFKNNKVKTVRYLSNPALTKEEFPGNLSWLFELLLYIPFNEQVERESFINSLPDKLIDRIYDKYKDRQSDILEWLIKEPGTINEKYYTTLIFQLIEEKYISIHREDNFFEDLEYFQNQSLELIKNNGKLYEVYQNNKGKTEVPQEFSYFEPLILIISKEQLFEEFYEGLPNDLLDLNGKMQQFAREYIDNRIGKFTDNRTFINDMKILREASNQFFNRFFSFDDIE